MMNITEENDMYYWYNYVTGELDYISMPDCFAAYIPQSPASQALYNLYVDKLHLSPIEAAAKVLEAWLGQQKEDK